MPPPISDRFGFEVYLGRDGDIDEWLGTDGELDRPVLIRLLAPDAPAERVAEFLAAVRAAAISHVHLADVYAADTLPSGRAYAVQEWAGGVTLADRLRAGEAVPIEDFLPNAAGLASALAALHAGGAAHGGVTPRAIIFSAAHPAKLSGYGRAAAGTREADVQALARALALAATGGEVGVARLAPSQVRAGLPPEIDAALQAADRGRLDAAGLAARLQAAPTAVRPRGRAWSWRWLVPTALLLTVATATAGLGLTLRERPSGSRFLFPVAPVATAAPAPAPTNAPSTTEARGPGEAPVSSISVTASVYDPFGDDRERDEELSLIEDGDPDSGWRTERYLDPLPRVKEGLGLTFATVGAPGSVELLASDGMSFMLAWSPQVPEAFATWSPAAHGRIVGGRARVHLPHREGGVWLVWITDLPPQEDGEFFYGFVYEVRFRA